MPNYVEQNATQSTLPAIGHAKTAVYSPAPIRNHGPMSALAGIAATPPDLGSEVVADAVASQFGRRGELRPLVSERDQNFQLAASDG